MDRRAFHKLLMGIGVAGCSPGERVRTWDAGADTMPVEEDTAPCRPVGPAPPTSGLVFPEVNITAYINGGSFRRTNLCEYYDKANKLLVIVISAAWCGPCQQYAQWMAANGGPLMARGVKFLEVLIDDFTPMKPATQQTVDKWIDMFKSPMDTGIAVLDQLVAKPSDIGYPTSILIDPASMIFKRTLAGWDTSTNPPLQFQQIDEYLKAIGA